MYQTQKEMVDIASSVGKNEVRDIALFMKGNTDLILFVTVWKIRRISSPVQVSHSNNDGFHTYVMKHDIGRNWSIYHKTILELIFQEVFNRRILVKDDKILFHSSFQSKSFLLVYHSVYSTHLSWIYYFISWLRLIQEYRSMHRRKRYGK